MTTETGARPLTHVGRVLDDDLAVAIGLTPPEVAGSDWAAKGILELLERDRRAASHAVRSAIPGIESEAAKLALQAFRQTVVSMNGDGFHEPSEPAIEAVLSALDRAIERLP